MDNPTLRERVKAIIEQEFTCRESRDGRASICYCDGINCLDEQQVSAIMSLMSEAEVRGKAIVVEAMEKCIDEEACYDRGWDCSVVEAHLISEAARNA